jgi:hypothetical protein
MSRVGAVLVFYLPLVAVWLVLVGAVLNGSRRLIVVPLVFGAVTGVGAVVTGIAWLLVPVVLAWLWGIVWMVRDQRRTHSAR